jgi:hypothetical protein
VPTPHLLHQSQLSHLIQTPFKVISTNMKIHRHHECCTWNHLFFAYDCFASLSYLSLSNIYVLYCHSHLTYFTCYCPRFSHRTMRHLKDPLYVMCFLYCLCLILLITFLTMVTHLEEDHSFSYVTFSFYCLVF